MKKVTVGNQDFFRLLVVFHIKDENIDYEDMGIEPPSEEDYLYMNPDHIMTFNKSSDDGIITIRCSYGYEYSVIGTIEEFLQLYGTIRTEKTSME